MIRLKSIGHYFATNLRQYYMINKHQDAIFFTSQKTKWSFNELNIQSQSLVRGLNTLKFIKDDTILVKLSPNQQMELLTLKIASANLQLNLIESKASNQQDFEKQLKKYKARALLFDSYNTIGTHSVIQMIYEMIPSLRQAIPGKQIMASDYRYLRYLIQTDNYPFAGTTQFKNVLRYGLSTDYIFFFECNQQPKQQLGLMQDRQRPILITNPLSDFVFEGAILNCMTMGRAVYIVETKNFKKLSQNFQHEIDYVGTQQVQISPKSRVFLPQGSKLFKQHKNRFQI